MLRRIDEPLRMRHQPENPAGRIAHARHVGHGTVGVGARARVVGGVPQHEVAARLEASARLGGVGDEPSFSMGDGQFEPLDATQEGTAAVGHPELNPAIDEPAGRVGGERRLGTSVRPRRQEQPRLHEHLEAVADPEDEASSVAELFQEIAEPHAELHREDPAAGDVVAVGKAPRDADDPALVEQPGLRGEPAKRHADALGTGPLEGVGRLSVAVGAGSAEDQGAWSRHVEKLRESDRQASATAMGQIDDVRRCVTSDFKRAGNGLHVVGLSRDCLAGSQIERLLAGDRSFAESRVPEVDAAACRAVFDAVSRAQAEGLVAACHDLSDGGLLAAATEMAIGGTLGGTIDLAMVPLEITAGAAAMLDRDAIAAFTETPGRFLCEVPEDASAAFERIMEGVPHARIGTVDAGDSLTVTSSTGDTSRIGIGSLADAWRSLSRSFST